MSFKQLTPFLFFLSLICAVGALSLSAQAAQPRIFDPGPLPAVAERAEAILSGELRAYQTPFVYLVELDDSPLARYRGEIAGLAATSPQMLGERKLDVNSPAAIAYLDYLTLQQTELITNINLALGRSVHVIGQYKYAFNSIAVWLSAEEVATVAALDGVKRLHAEEVHQLQTDAGPEWIGAPGIWDGSKTAGLLGTKGEGVVIAVIDSGVNFNHPSFRDIGPVDGHDHDNPLADGNPLTPDYLGVCDPLTGAPFCNDKLIGVYDCNSGACAEGIGAGQPVDVNGHGSHTASTSGGNEVQTTIEGADGVFAIDVSITGVAPHANLITYKGCVDTGNCVTVGLTAAIDRATADAAFIDVINYSIGGGSSDPWSDGDAQSFLSAYEAGILVATSAGNDGAGPGTVGSPGDAPWVTTVGAGTHDRAFVNTLTDMTSTGNGSLADINGKSFTSGYGPAPIVHASGSGDGQCLNPFPPGTWSNGEIVVCDRGTIPRVEKCRNVGLGGAEGCVLANTVADGDSTVADPHEIPAIHIGYSEALILAGWMASGSDHMATIAGTSAIRDPANADLTAGFSSRGPNPANANYIKPDIIAPGVDILAAKDVSNNDYGTLSGTSMSSPHVAGSAALLVALHPDWTPGEIRSAMMTTSFTHPDGGQETHPYFDDNGIKVADPFDIGAGRVNLENAARAGLLLDVSGADYTAADPTTGGDPRTLNLPSMADVDCRAMCSWTRTVHSPLDSSVEWTASFSSTSNVVLDISPSTFVLPAGGSQEIAVTADVRTAPPGVWAFARLILTPDDSDVPVAQMPVAVLPGGEAIPVEINTRRAAGSQFELDVIEAPIDVLDLTITPFDLFPSILVEELVVQDPTVLDPYDNEVGTFHISVDVPNGTQLLTTAIIDTDSSDLDLFVGLDVDGDGPDATEEVCSSASATALESCTISVPAGGTYWIMVQNWLGGASNVTLQTVVLPGQDDDTDDLNITGPATATAGDLLDLRLFWNEPDMQAGETWFGLARLGSSPTSRAPGDLGAVIFKVNRLADDVTKTADSTEVDVNDTVAYTVQIEPNVRSVDMSYTITDTVSIDGTLNPASVSVSSGTTSVNGNTIVWDVTMPVGGSTPATLTYDVSADVDNSFMINHADHIVSNDPGSKIDSESVVVRVGNPPPTAVGLQNAATAAADNGMIALALLSVMLTTLFAIRWRRQ